ncbi:MAG: hypothetical protein K2I16_05905 [Muribaculaceae bacterium]|nr:hypothetical protein [Muribaculaceae bacterium]MDE5713142.1 hypothetical protein [Muribaculaceae bacterium]
MIYVVVAYNAYPLPGIKTTPKGWKIAACDVSQTSRIDIPSHTKFS